MMGAVLTYLRGLKPRGKAGFAFGSYGWGRGGAERLDEWLKDNKWEVLSEPIKAQYAQSPEVLASCRDAGKLLADKALNG